MDLWMGLTLVEGCFAPKCFQEKLPFVEQPQNQGWTPFYSFLSATICLGNFTIRKALGRRVQSSGAGCNPRPKLGVATADDDLTPLGTLVLTSEDGTCLRAVFI